MDTVLVLFTLYTDGLGDFLLCEKILDMVQKSGYNKIKLVLCDNSNTRVTNLDLIFKKIKSIRSSGTVIEPIIDDFLVTLMTYLPSFYSDIKLLDNPENYQSTYDLSRIDQSLLYKLNTLAESIKDIQLIPGFDELPILINTFREKKLNFWFEKVYQIFIANPNRLVDTKNIYIVSNSENTTNKLIGQAVDIPPVKILNYKFVPSRDFRMKENTIDIGEGGECEEGYIVSMGYNRQEDDTCMGFQQLTNIDEITRPIDNMVGPINITENYYFAYFGGFLNRYMYQTHDIKFLFKFRAFINNINDPGDLITVYLNEPAYLKLISDIGLVVFQPRNISDDGMRYGRFIIKPYRSFTHKQFLQALYFSNQYCALTGDQSFFEGLSMGKNVFYDVLHHKIRLFIQVVRMYVDYYNKYIRSDNLDINRLYDTIEPRLTFAYGGGDKLEMIKYKTLDSGKTIANFTNIAGTLHILTETGFSSRRPDIVIYNSREITQLYADINKVLIPSVLADDKFVQWYRTTQNFSVNFTNKYLKYKAKYEELEAKMGKE